MKNAQSAEAAITVTGLRKEFLLPHQRRTSVKQVFINVGRKNYKTRQKVLDGIDFEIKKGEFFGIVGRNGSGKSTLLKILAGVYRPTSGKVDINGELTPFIELGVGFNPELTGRDNIFLNGALLGFSRKEMEAMYDDIVAFSELDQFMDQKLKNYSSGMQVRLAFSIAIKAHNDILIFDEVLAVGDEAFQRKCLDIFEKYKANKQTVILVSHDMETVRKYCTRAMLLDKGKIIALGNPQKVARQYSELNQQEIDAQVEAGNKNRKSSIGLQAQIYGDDKKPKVAFEVGERMQVKVSWKSDPKLDSIVVNIYKQSGEHVTGFKTKRDGLKLDAKSNEVWAKIGLDLFPGKYYLLIQSLTKEDREMETIVDGPQFSVKMQENMAWAGLVNLEHTWTK